MKQVYRDPKNMRQSTRELLDDIIDVVEQFAADGYRMTLRQLYYQLVTKNIKTDQTIVRGVIERLRYWSTGELYDEPEAES